MIKAWWQCRSSKIYLLLSKNKNRTIEKTSSTAYLKFFPALRPCLDWEVNVNCLAISLRVIVSSRPFEPLVFIQVTLMAVTSATFCVFNILHFCSTHAPSVIGRKKLRLWVWCIWQWHSKLRRPKANLDFFLSGGFHST